MTFDLIKTFVTQSQLRVKFQKPTYEAFKFFADFIIYPSSIFLPIYNLINKYLWLNDVFSLKRILTIRKLIGNYSKGPEIYMSSALSSHDKFRCKIILSSYLHVLFFVRVQLPGKSKVRELDIAIFKYKQILRFEIAIGNFLLVQSLKSKYNTTQNKSDRILARFLK